MACLRADKETTKDCHMTAAPTGGSGGVCANGNATPDQPSIVQIYTDWANHYLEKAKFRRFIQDLQIDLADGVLLADVIEAVTNEKVKDIIRKPKNVTQMLDNINASLSYLAGLGVNVEGLVARDIRDGNLKAILGLFFSISRYKQQQKQASSGGSTVATSVGNRSSCSTTHLSGNSVSSSTRQSSTSGTRVAASDGETMQSKLPSPFRQSGSSRLSTVSSTTNAKEVPNSNIPTPASGSSLFRRGGSTGATAAERSRLSGGGIPQLQGLGLGNSRAPSASSSRSTSPSAATATSQSLIPHLSAKGPLTRQPTSAVDKSSSKQNSGHPSPGITTKGPVSTTVSLKGNGHVTTTSTPGAAGPPQGKNSMLDKFKFFNSKDKSEKGGAVTTSKRTSSSSGFSSARSERSDSSNSICSETKGCSSSTTPTTTTSGDTRDSSPVRSTATSENGSSPKLVVKSFARKTFGRSLETNRETSTKQASPKTTLKTLETSKKSTITNSPSANSGPGRTKHSGNEAGKAERESDTPKGGIAGNRTAQESSQNRVTSGLEAAIQPDNPVKESKISSLVVSKAAEPSTATKPPVSKDCPSGESSLSSRSHMQATINQVAVGVGTSIPKPTAAVKGTTKVSKDDRRTDKCPTLSNTSDSSRKPTSAINGGSTKVLPSDKSAGLNSSGKADGSSQVDFALLMAESGGGGSSSVTSPSMSLLRASRNERGRNLDNNATNVSIAMVSPMPSSTLCDPVGGPGSQIFGQEVHSGDHGKPPKPYQIKGDTVCRSGLKVGGNVGGSSTLLTRSKMETTFDSTDEVITRETTSSPAATKETTFSEEPEDIVINIKPMQPIVRASHYGYARGLGTTGFSSARALVPSVHVARLGLGRHAFSSSQDAILSGSGAFKRLPSASHGSIVDGTMDYGSDVDSVDLAGGYMSDGDMLRGHGRGGNDDIASGYVSEGGASLYSRRLQNRLREAMTVVGESNQKSTLIQDRRNGTSGYHPRSGLDDSSSISSGLSDTIAEISTDDNLTGSSVGSDQTNPYGSLKRTPKDGHYRGTPQTSDRSRKGTATDLQQAKISCIGSGRPSVRKADSSQQTENSVFRNSNSALKKSVEVLHRGKSDLENDRNQGRGTRDALLSSGTGHSQGSGGILRKSGASSVSASGGGSPKSKRKMLSTKMEDGGGNISTRHISEFGYPMERCSPRSSRGGGSVETHVMACGMGSGSGNKSHTLLSDSGRKSHSTRPGPSATSLVYSASAKRPNSTCSVSSTGSSSKSGCSRGNSKKSSSEQLSELDGVSVALGTSGSLDHVRHQASMAHVSGIPRPGSAQSSSSSSSNLTLEHKSKSGRRLTSLQTLQELYGLGSGEATTSYSHDSLGRMHKLQPSQYPYGSSTIPPPSKDYSTIISNPHASLSNRERALRSSASPSPSSKDHHQQGGCSDSGVDHPSPYSVTFAMDVTNGSSNSGGGSPYSSWLRRSPSNASSMTGFQMHRVTGSLTEAESLESLASNASSIHAQIQHARANSLTHACLALHQRHTSPSPRLARSNSIRSTKSEKLYPSMLQRSEDLDTYLSGPMSASVQPNPRNMSQPASPTPDGQTSAKYAYPMNLLLHSGAHSTSSSPSHGPSRASSTIPSYVGGLLSKLTCKDDDLHGSSLSLASIASSVYSTPEEKHNHEIRKLRRELAEAHDKVQTLTSQLSTGTAWQATTPGSGGGTWPLTLSTSGGGGQDWQAQVVAAFEQSLANMTSRLHTLAQSAEQKDSELNELRATIEALRKQSAEAGLTSAHFGLLTASALQSPACVRRGQPTISNGTGGIQEHRMSRQLSTDSMSSINSASSACSAISHVSAASQKSGDAIGSCKKKKKKGWLRSSFSKAFSRSKKNRNGSVSDVEDMRQHQSDTSAPNSPLLNAPHAMGGIVATGIKTSHSSSAIYDKEDDTSAPETVVELRKQLREKDMVLTDIRLEALSSAHQLESLKETVNKMRTEMLNLKHDNERLQRLVSTKSLTSSQSSLPNTDSLDQRLSVSEMSGPSSIDLLLSDVATHDKDGKRVCISVCSGCHGDGSINSSSIKESCSSSEVMIGSILVSGKTRWDVLDGLVRRSFKEYVLRVDPVSNLGLNAESVHCYHLGEVTIAKDSELPELLPCGYLVGDSMTIRLTLKGTKQNSVDSLAFDTLIPKSIIHRYVSLLTEHRRIILCGPSGTGKTYLAHKLAEFLVLRSGKNLTPGSIATFNVDHKSAKELRQYLSNVAEQCEGSNAADLPSVIILDNLHHVGSLGEVFNGFLSAKYQKCPYIIGTMNQATCSTTNLQLHHNFRWVLCANHMEPVKGFLGRHLRRKLVDVEVKTSVRNNDLIKIIDWIPKVWQHLNKFLETHSSSDVTVGPRLLLSCPIDISASQVWFTDLWNYSVIPYLLEAVREGLQLYGRRAPWEDPTDWVIETYPWSLSNGTGSVDWPSLLKMRPEDVGYEGHPGPGGLGAKSVCSAQSDLEGDPLLNMLMRLQEAASYSSPHSNDSDTTSLDSHNSSVHTEDALTGGGIESTL